MNFRTITAIVSLFGLLFLLSCGEDEGDNNEIFDPASQYYIQFKANGKLKTYEADDVGFSSGGEMTQCIIPPDHNEFAGITMSNQSFVQITAAQIES